MWPGIKSRLNLLDELESAASAGSRRRKTAEHQKLYERASKMILSPEMKAFDLGQETGQNARRLRPRRISAPAACWRGGWSNRASRLSKSCTTAGTRTTTISTQPKKLAGSVDQPLAH